MKRSFNVLIIILAIIMSVLILVQAGCQATPSATPTTSPTSTAAPTATAKPTPTSTQTATVTPTSAPTPTATTAKPLVLTIAEYGAYGPGLQEVIQAWANEVEKRTSGRIKFGIHWGETLVKGAEMPEALAKNIADGGSFVTAYFPSKTPLSTVTELPGGTPNMLVAQLAFTELYATTPAVQKEWEQYNAKLMWVYGQPSYNLLLKRPIATLAEAKGIKIRTHGAALPKLMTALGLTPVSISATETYEAIARGIVEGLVTYVETLYRRKYYEVAPNYIIADIGAAASAGFTLTLNAWNKISPADQKIIEDINKEWAKYEYDYFNKQDAAWIKQIQAEKPFKITELAAADKEKIKTAGFALWDPWAQDMEAKGLPGKDVMARWRTLTEKYNKQI